MTGHRERAVEIVGSLHTASQLDPAQAMYSVAVAQVHATLALVEQQRIANLIALSHESAPAVGPKVTAYPRLAGGTAENPVWREQVDASGQYWADLAAQVRDGLGLS